MLSVAFELINVIKVSVYCRRGGLWRAESTSSSFRTSLSPGCFCDRLQTSVKGVTPFQMAADILNDTGVRGFYRGVISPVAGAGMIKASVFGGYGVFKDLVWRFAEKREQFMISSVGTVPRGVFSLEKRYFSGNVLTRYLSDVPGSPGGCSRHRIVIT